MKIQVTAVGKFQRHFPARTCQVEFPGGTLQDFLAWTKDAHGLDASAHRNLKLTHNQIMAKDLTVQLQDGDRVGFIPIVAGG